MEGPSVIFLCQFHQPIAKNSLLLSELANGLEGTEAKPKGILLLPVAVYSGNAQHIFSLPLLAENQMAVAIVAMEQKSIARQRPILHGQATNILQLQADAL